MEWGSLKLISEFTDSGRSDEKSLGRPFLFAHFLNFW